MRRIAYTRIVLAGLVVFAYSTGTASDLAVRVDPAGGAPRLLVNGKPVRPRIFLGEPGFMPLRVTAEGKEVSVEFIAPKSINDATMQLGFGGTAGDLYLDDVRLTDLDAKHDVLAPYSFEGGAEAFNRDWESLPDPPPDKKGRPSVEAKVGRDGSAALHIATKPQDGWGWVDYRISYKHPLTLTQGHRYRMSVWARSKPDWGLNLKFLQPGNPTPLNVMPDCFVPQIKMAAAAGVNIVGFHLETPWPEPPAREDWTAIDRLCRQVVEANPKTLLLPHFGLGQYPPTPRWWQKAHPDEMMQFDRPLPSEPVVNSPIYQRDSEQRMRAMVEHLEKTFGDRIAGYYIEGHNTSEWFYVYSNIDVLNGFSLADRTAWRRWLTRQYGSDETLRRAWADRKVTLATAEVPSAKARRAAPNGVFRDPATERAIIDWGQYQQEAMADDACRLAHVVRTASGGRKLVMLFYGYLYEFSAWNGPAPTGHYALRRVLDCPDIDIVQSVVSYFDRESGGGAPSISVPESIALAGKMSLSEDDSRTYLSFWNPSPNEYKPDTIEETLEVLTRNVAQMSLRNMASWWRDLTFRGWFNDARMWDRMKQLDALDEAMIKAPTPYRPEVAAVVDEHSMMMVAAGGEPVTKPVVFEARVALGRMGAPYGQYMLDDVAAGRVKAKLYVFHNAWRLSGKQRESILKATSGAARVWCYAPGYFDDDNVSPRAMRELTGFQLKPVQPKSAAAMPTQAGKRLGILHPLGGGPPPKPLLAAADATGDEVLATYDDGSPAVAMRCSDGGASIFVGAPGMSAELLRAAARSAGVHLFSEVDCNVYANGRFLAVHASKGGNVPVNVGRKVHVTDLLTGQTVGAGPKLTLSLKRGKTMILRLEDE